MLDKQKVEIIAEKQWKDRGGSNLLVEDDGYYDSDISGTNPD